MGTEKHPKGLPILFLTEMWERFSFYLMIGILPLYLTDRSKGGMGWADEKMAVIVGSYMGLVYFTPFLGGLIADRLLGCRKTILIGATLMMIGHLVLAWPGEVGLYLGLLFLILGNGAFKPNISTLLGNLYPPGSPLKDTGYNIFYMGINIGAFFCNFVAALVRNYFDAHPWQITADWTLIGWHAAFATAAIGMFLGLVIFGSNYRRFAQADQNPTEASGSAAGESLAPLFVQCLIPAAILGVIGWLAADWLQGSLPWGLGDLLPAPPAPEALPAAIKSLSPPLLAFFGACVPVVLFYVRIWRSVPDHADRGRVAALLTIFGIVIIFWVTYGLNTTALNIWTRDDTARGLTAPVRLITDRIPDFAENAPPEYYYNAAPDVPRPAPQTFEIVTRERYRQLEQANELSVRENEPVYVTKEMFDKVYAKANPNVPRIEQGKHLRLVNTELFQSINPGLIIIFTPLVVALWHFLRQRGKEPSTAAKMGMGLLLSGLAPAIMLGATAVSHDGVSKASSLWLFGTYGAVGLGELFLSSMGLSLVNKMSPAALRASMMGGWFVSTAVGLKVSGVFGEVYARMKTESDHETFWVVLIAANVVSAVAIFLLLPWLNRQMAGGREETPLPTSPSQPEAITERRPH
jgi:POT family proton-dependent oligopeptide transporter